MDKMRAALCPIVGDPCLFNFWWNLFGNWQDEVDKLYLYINGVYVHPKLADFIRETVSANNKTVFKHLIPGNDHGYGLKALVEDSTEENLMFIEDDGWIFKKGAVDAQFQILESGRYDLIGSPRGSIDMKIYQKELEVFNVREGGLGDNGPNWWPNFLFVKRWVLEKTDLHFWGKVWNKGDYIKELNYTVEDDGVGADTFSWASIQIRGFLPQEKIGTVPQYKCYPHDPTWYESKTWTFEGSAKWIHAGSISSGMNSYLLDNRGVPLRDLYNPNGTPADFPSPTQEHEIDDFSMRTAFWEIVWEEAGLVKERLPDYYAEYRNAIDRLIKRFDLPRDKIDTRKKIYKELLGI